MLPAHFYLLLLGTFEICLCNVQFAFCNQVFTGSNSLSDSILLFLTGEMVILRDPNILLYNRASKLAAETKLTLTGKSVKNMLTQM